MAPNAFLSLAADAGCGAGPSSYRRRRLMLMALYLSSVPDGRAVFVP